MSKSKECAELDVVNIKFVDAPYDVLTDEVEFDDRKRLAGSCGIRVRFPFSGPPDNVEKFLDHIERSPLRAVKMSRQADFIDIAIVFPRLGKTIREVPVVGRKRRSR